MQTQFRKILSSVLAGIETHATTGEVVSRRPAVATTRRSLSRMAPGA